MSLTPTGSPGGGSGDVVGPGSATDGHLAVFDGATGKLIKDGGSAGGGGSFLSANTARVDPSGNDGTGEVGDLNKPFLTVQGAIDALEAADPILEFPVIDIGNNDFSGANVATSLNTIVFVGRAGTPLFLYSDNSLGSIDTLNSPFGTLTITGSADVVVIVKDCYKCDSIVIPDAEGFSSSIMIQLLNSVVEMIQNDSAGPIAVDGGNTSHVDNILFKQTDLHVSNLNIGTFTATLDSGDTEPGVAIYMQNCNINDISDTGLPLGVGSVQLRNCTLSGDLYAPVSTVEAANSLIRNLNCDSASFVDSRVYQDLTINTPIVYEDRLLKGIAPGGTTGQALEKASNDDFDTSWESLV